MDQRRIGGARTTKKTLIRPIGMSAQQWKTLKRKRMRRPGTRKMKTAFAFNQYTKANVINAMKNNNNIGELFGATTKSSKLSRKQVRSMSTNFKRTLRALKKQEKTRLTRIAEEHNISEKELDDHIDNIIYEKLTELANLVPQGDATSKKLTADLYREATRGLEYGDEATNPDYSDSKQKRYQKKFRNSLKKAFIIQKTYEGGDTYFGREQGAIAFHEFMQQALTDRIHRERPDLDVDDLANIFAGKIGKISD
jgi:hypothetical protein